MLGWTEKNRGPEDIQKIPQKPLFRATQVKYTNYEKVVGRHYTQITSEEYLKAQSKLGGLR